MSFDKNLPGWLYVVESKTHGYRKIGITNYLENRMMDHGKDWYLVFAYYNSGFIVSLIESAALAWVRARIPESKINKEQMPNHGYSETFPITRRVTYKSLHRYLVTLVEVFSQRS